MTKDRVVCAGCADDKPAKRIHYCCGRPFCLRCYETHVEEEHA